MRGGKLGNQNRVGKFKYDGIPTRQMRVPKPLIPGMKLLMAALYSQDPEVMAIVERLQLNNQNTGEM